MTKSYYVAIDANNRIYLLTAEKQSDEQFLFEFPEEFDEWEIINYKIIDGKLVYSEFIYTANPSNDPIE